MIVIIDHQDSFTYNIYAMLKSFGEEVKVLSTLESCLKDIADLNPKCLILSPGPGVPNEAPLFFQALDTFKNKIPILGICLGHQAIAEYFGGTVGASASIQHGKIVAIHHEGHFLFNGLPNEFSAMRYNSLCVKLPLPPKLVATAWCDGEVMAIRHSVLPIVGVQFHPESVGTPEGKKILTNFLKNNS
jgi:anthranilate synthase/aminodeoxychorismate synthase-like glutamine amidotransferase